MKTIFCSAVSVILAAFLTLVLSSTTVAQQNFERNSPSYADVAGYGPNRQGLNKFLRVLGVAAQYSEPLAVDKPKTLRKIRWVALAAAIGCELANCNAPEQPTYTIPQPEYLPMASQSNAYPRAVNESIGTLDSNAYSFASSSNARHLGSNSPQDQPSQGLRAAVARAVQRIRQIGGVIRNIRFRRVGPWTWDCEIIFNPRNGASDSFCRVRSNGVIEGI